MLLAGVAMLPGIAAAQSAGSAPQSIPDLGGFSLPPKPKPTPTPPPSGPVIAPFSRPTPIPTFAPTPSPAPSAAVTPPPVVTTRPTAAATPTSRPTPRAATTAPQATPTSAPAPVAGATPAPVASATPEPLATPTASTAPVAPAAAQPSGGWSRGTLIAIGVAIAALLGAGWFLFGRRRRRDEDYYEEEVAAPVAPPVAPRPPAPRPAAAPVPTPAPVPAPIPEPVPAAPSGLLTVPLRRIAEGLQAPPQPPAPPLPAGLVTVRAPLSPARSLEELKPELEIVLIPQRAGTDPSMSAAIEYRIVVRNNGRGDARDVRFGIYMTSASARQAADLQTIFGSPVEQPVVAPFEIHAGSQIELSGTAMLPRANLNVMTIDGKPWFVPVLAMKAEYRWGENVGAPGTATAAHMIGINRGEGAKLAPFRLDGEPRMHPRVAERRVA